MIQPSLKSRCWRTVDITALFIGEQNVAMMLIEKGRVLHTSVTLKGMIQ